MRVLVIFGLLASLGMLLAGCSDAPSFASTPVGPPGSIRVAVQWPQVDGARVIPPETQAIVLTLLRGDTVVTSATLTRDEPTTTYAQMVPGEYLLVGQAYDANDATGVLVAFGQVEVPVASGQVAEAELVLTGVPRIAFVLDKSGSMFAEMPQVVASMNNYLNYLESYGIPAHRLCGITIGEVNIVHPGTYGEFRTWVTAEPNPEDAVYDTSISTLEAVWSLLADEVYADGIPMVIFVITDGSARTVTPEHGLDETIARLHQAGTVVVHAISPGASPDARDLADATGGRWEFIDDGEVNFQAFSLETVLEQY